jgi:Cu(I)/Ag(I) efflux system membrane fusion protein
MSNRKQIVISIALIAVAALIVIAWTLLSRGDTAQSASTDDMAGMDMGGTAATEAKPVMLDADAERRIGVTYATADRKPFRRVVTTVGNVTWDETRLVNVNAKIEGWVEHLYLDFTGAAVTRGQPLLAVYSPMLVSAQEELLLARRLVQSAAAGGRAAQNANDLLDSARRRLRYWDIPEDEIARIEREGSPQKTLTLRAPASGIVVEKMVVQGMRIMPGMDLYRIADLSRVWIEGEVFEKDLSLVKLRQLARVTFDAYAGQEFDGEVTYVYPTVSADSRTGRVRIELSNPGLRMKPGMYARVALSAGDAGDALVIPRSAVHYTGERTMVFVRDADGMLVPREITVGLAAGDEIEVLAGLTEGTVVVSSANFLIDAESNMGSSMHSMPGMDVSGQRGGAPADSTKRDSAGNGLLRDGHAGHSGS